MEVILVGGFIEMIELCEKCNIKIVGIIDNNLKGSINGYPILGTDSNAPQLFNEFHSIPLVITPDLPVIRKKLVMYYAAIGFSFESVISPSAELSKSATIGKGVVIQSGVNISSNVFVNEFVKLNTNANIMHDCRIGAFSTVAPNAVVLGRVSIFEQCYIGANSTILPEIEISKNVIVGAGAVVSKNIEEGLTVKGVPAKV
jgi:sugar O-acyltransferase (sialic acid O-acetyltransferase NeuD family)